MSDIRGFIFNCMLAENELDELSKTGTVSGRKLSTEILRVIETDFNPLIWNNAEKMSSIYRALFCIENTIRIFIVDRLAERKGIDWWEECVPKKIKDEVNRLKEGEQKNKYLSSRSQTNIGYTMLGNLSQIIISNWDEFSDMIPDQAWLNSRMTDLEKCRNVIMHTGSLTEYDIDRIENIIRDILRQIG
jgi:hypothetical protein